MKRVGTYQVAVQAGKHGHFARVDVDVEVVPGRPGLAVDFAEGISTWRAGAQFGVAYAYEKTRRHFGPNQAVRVTVTELRGHEVDTTEVVVAFAAAWAFWRAVEQAPTVEPTADFGTGMFMLPK